MIEKVHVSGSLWAIVVNGKTIAYFGYHKVYDKDKDVK
jgi:hypothetical protein